MRLCLVWPKSTFLIDPMVFPPLGLWYVWSLLEGMGHEVAYRDLAEDDLPLEGYDAYLVSGTSPQAYEIRKIGRILRDHGKRAILGGSHAGTHSGEECLNYGYDVVVGGEADAPGILAQALEAPSGTYIRAPLTPRLDHVGRPCRKAAWRYKAFLEDENHKKHPTTTLFTSRGCPMRCAFCETVAIWGRNVRWVPYETVKSEIEEIVDLGFTGIMFYDDIFPLNKPRTLKMLDILGYYHRTQGLIWRCFLRVDVLAKQGGFEYLEQMYRAGLREVLAGVETGSNEIKNNVQKGTTIEQDTEALRWCQKLGIKFKASFILGLPGETRETLEATRRWILENRPDRVDVNTYIPFPGTPITKAVAEEDHDYDIYWDTSVITEEFWYKGPRDQGNSLVGTSALTPEELGAFRNKLIEEIAEIPY
jgi:radical SAM superfamily enzyme YgiQ (UPF0313 family)